MKYEDFDSMPEGTRLEFFEPETCIAIRPEIGKQFPKVPYSFDHEDFFIVVKQAKVTFIGRYEGDISVRIEGNYRGGRFVYGGGSIETRAVTRRVAPEYIRSVV